MPKLSRRFLWWLYIGFLVIPIYWLVVMSLKTNEEILGELTLLPRHPTLANYVTIVTDRSWYMGYVNSLEYVVLNTALSLAVALPAAYAFSRFTFVGDKHLFFWLLSNRMSPPAVFLLPFFQSRSHIHYSMSRWRCGFLRGSCRRCPARSTRWRTWTDTGFPRSSSGSSCR
jgi:glycerol transport system permease protein